MITQISNNEFLLHLLSEHIGKGGTSLEPYFNLSDFSVEDLYAFVSSFSSAMLFLNTSWEALEMENLSLNPDLEPGSVSWQGKKRKKSSQTSLSLSQQISYLS